MEKKKRQTVSTPLILNKHNSSRSKAWQWIILFVVAILLPFIGAIYQIDSRFTLPLAIFTVWIAGAMALWDYRKSHSA